MIIRADSLESAWTPGGGAGYFHGLWDRFGIDYSAAFQASVFGVEGRVREVVYVPAEHASFLNEFHLIVNFSLVNYIKVFR